MFPEAYQILAQPLAGLGDDIDYFFSNLLRASMCWICFNVVSGVGVGVWLLRKKMKAKPPVLKKNPDD